MGVQLGQLTNPKEVSLDDLKGKKLALDTYNMLYQFLATIRQADGRPFTDSKGEVTAHLLGLFYRTSSLLEAGIRPVYAFDGKPSPLKAHTLRGRAMVKAKAAEEWEAAVKAGDLELAKKKAAQTSRITEQMAQDAKSLLDAMGVPWVQAPSEGEAQAAHMAKKGDVWGAASEDYDTLLFGSPRLVRGLAALKTGQRDHGSVRIVEADELLKGLGISIDELILMGMLIGTDFNEGFPGIGPKRALKLATAHRGYSATIESLGGDPASLEEVRQLFLNPPSTDEYSLQWKKPDPDRIASFLVESHGFDEGRVARVVDRLQRVEIREEEPQKPVQVTLDLFGGN